MHPSIVLLPSPRYTLLDYYRAHPDPALRLHAHIILLLADGRSWDNISAVLYCSTATISRWQQRFLDGGIPALVNQTRGPAPRLGAAWCRLLVFWVTQRTPRAFGFLRSRWCCAVLALVLRQVHGLRVSRETVRRRLHDAQLVWRRPRPTLGPQDPNKQAILDELRQLLTNLPDDEVAVFQDEVDINTNPKIGAMWMLRGQQATVQTPGNNEKRYLAGSMNWRSGQLVRTLSQPKQGRNAAWFLRHLDELRRHYRRYRVIHVICDNAKAHDCKAVVKYLQRWGHRIKLHYLPRYAPETNPIERVWWHLHEEITRNHRCRSLAELLELVFAWLEDRSPFEIEGSVYPKPRVA
jgi:putative transposase